ncbi:GntR family transcriptional regulator [uncultured Paracoccus sp.]|uniref:GntR family transcriptional regulator n=1 Tax=uncultured Paracoccus sp. TaxID=189685 RepID=UPI0026114BBD|nr:GntR family transcriptional regulator [uncultured Paracoccus sp.]
MKPTEDLQSDQAFRMLLAQLRSGRLRGSALLATPELVELIGFPLSATREAIKRAEEQSLLRILPKRGVVIMDTGPETTRDCMDMRATLDKEGARRLLAAGTPDLSALRRAHEALLAEVEGDPAADLSQRAITTDLSLHDFLASGLDNPFLQQAYAANRNRIAIIQNARNFLPDRVRPAMQEHLEIITALESGDSMAVTDCIDHHLKLTLRWWGIEG